MTLNDWYSFFQGGSVVLLLVTCVFGAGAVLTGLRVNREASAALRRTEMELATQQERAADAERRLLELQEIARPRTIDADARAKIIESLQLGGQRDAPMVIEFVSGSTREPYNFAVAIRDVISAAGWPRPTLDGGPAVGAPPFGLSIRISDVGGVDEQATRVEQALASGGIPSIIVKDRRFTPGQITLMVGLKP